MPHPIALLHARSLPAEVCLSIAVHKLGQVEIVGDLPIAANSEDMALLKEACEAMTYPGACHVCGPEKARPAADFSRDSLSLDLCRPCMEYAEAENAHSDHDHHESNADPDCPICKDEPDPAARP